METERILEEVERSAVHPFDNQVPVHHAPPDSPAFDAAPLRTVQIQSYIHGRKVLLQKLGVAVTTKRIQEASHFNTAHPDPSALSDAMF